MEARKIVLEAELSARPVSLMKACTNKLFFSLENGECEVWQTLVVLGWQKIYEIKVCDSAIPVIGIGYVSSLAMRLM
jgi:hypothetical protein